LAGAAQAKACGYKKLPLEGTLVLHSLSQAPGFPYPHRHPVHVEVTQQQNGKFPGGLGQVLELRYGDSPVFLQEVHQGGLELGQGVGVEI
jgi:hypothetical protein